MIISIIINIKQIIRDWLVLHKYLPEACNTEYAKAFHPILSTDESQLKSNFLFQFSVEISNLLQMEGFRLIFAVGTEIAPSAISV